jgi:hypothetical protein
LRSEKWEAVASENDKIQVWIWLANPRTAANVERWPETFARMFDRVFGTKHLSWICFYRSSIASLTSLLIACLCFWSLRPALFHPMISLFKSHWLVWACIIVAANVLPDYISLLESRYVLSKMRRGQASSDKIRWAAIVIGLLLADLVITLFLAALASQLASRLWELAYSWILIPQAQKRGSIYAALARLQYAVNSAVLTPLLGGRSWFWIYPALFTSIWLWLYASAGFLLIAARRVDVGFRWFNRHFDIEHKPLSAIGFVAGALVALVYWVAVVVVRVL